MCRQTREKKTVLNPSQNLSPYVEPQIKMNNCLERETLELSKLLNQALCFGNFIILVRDWGR